MTDPFDDGTTILRWLRQRRTVRLRATVTVACKERKDEMFVEIDDDVQKIVKEILRDHPRLVDTVKGRSGADPFVIALAQTTIPSMTVLTEEFKGEVRIPDVWDARGIKWLNLADMIEEEDWKSGG